MEQHPVPQQISAYHFRLVGDMTIKQFLELAGGCLIAWIFYSLPLPGILRWPLVLFSVFTGVALAFLPLEERPLDRWFFAFIHAIYSPTKYVWKKTTIMPHVFEKIKRPKQPVEEQRQADRTKLKEYLETLPIKGPQTSLDKKENTFITNVMNMYMEVQPTTKSNIKQQAIIEADALPNVKVRKLKNPPPDPHAILRGEIIMPKRKATKPKRLLIPSTKPVEVEKIDPSQKHLSEKISQISKVSDEKTKTENLTLPKIQPKKINENSTPATTNTQLPFPAAPTTPNVIVGMVVDHNGNIVENAIVTIKDNQGNVARAQKTNKIGQFYIATPLKDGKYQIEIDAKDFSFDIMGVELKGKPIPPIEIKAKKQ